MKPSRSKRLALVRWKRLSRYFYLRFVRLRASPIQIARGLAIGIFWGMFPLPGLQMAVAIVTAAIFHSSTLAAAVGTWLTNPLTAIPITILNFKVGQAVLGRASTALPINHFDNLTDILDLGLDLLTSFFLGCFITGTIAGLLTYFLAVPVVEAMKRRAMEQRLRRAKKL